MDVCAKGIEVEINLQIIGSVDPDEEGRSL